jgi:hypothetical protein
MLKRFISWLCKIFNWNSVNMTTSNVTLNLGYYPDPTTGRPVANGYIYIGKQDLNPQVPSNQKQITLVLEDGSSVLVGQPLRTGGGGVVLYNGSPAQVTVDGTYSIKILNSFQSQIYYIPRNTGTTGGLSGQDFSIVVDDGTGGGNEFTLLGLIDENKYRRYGGTATFEYQIPNDASVAWNDDTEIFLHLYGLGSIDVVPEFGSGVTVNYPATGIKISGEGHQFNLKKVGLDEWDLAAIQDFGAPASVHLDSGTEAVPTLSWASDIDTGFYRSGTGEQSWTSNGTRTAVLGPTGMLLDKNSTGIAEVMTQTDFDHLFVAVDSQVLAEDSVNKTVIVNTAITTLFFDTSSLSVNGDTVNIHNLSSAFTLSFAPGTATLSTGSGLDLKSTIVVPTNSKLSLRQRGGGSWIFEASWVSLGSKYYEDKGESTGFTLEGQHANTALEIRNQVGNPTYALSLLSDSNTSASEFMEIDISWSSAEIGAVLTVTPVGAEIITCVSGDRLPTIVATSTSNVYSFTLKRVSYTEWRMVKVSEGVDGALPTAGGTMTGPIVMTVEDSLVFDHPTLTESGISMDTDPAAHSLVLRSGEDTTSGGWVKAYAHDDSAFPGEVSLGFGDVGETKAISVTGTKKVQSWNQDGSLFNDTATIDDVSSMIPSPISITTTPVTLDDTALNNTVTMLIGSDTIVIPNALGSSGDSITVFSSDTTQKQINASIGMTFTISADIGAGVGQFSVFVLQYQARVFYKIGTNWVTESSLLHYTPSMLTLGLTGSERQYQALDVGYNMRLQPAAGVSVLKLGDFGVDDLNPLVGGSSAIDYYIEPVDNCTIDFHADKVGDTLYFLGGAIQNFPMLAGQYYKVRIEKMQGTSWFVTIT